MSNWKVIGAGLVLVALIVGLWAGLILLAHARAAAGDEKNDPTHRIAVWCEGRQRHVHLRLPAFAPSFRVDLDAACGPSGAK